MSSAVHIYADSKLRKACARWASKLQKMYGIIPAVMVSSYLGPSDVAFPTANPLQKLPASPLLKYKKKKRRKYKKKRQKDKRPKQKFNIATSGQFRTLAMFVFCKQSSVTSVRM